MSSLNVGGCPYEARWVPRLMDRRAALTASDCVRADGDVSAPPKPRSRPCARAKEKTVVANLGWKRVARVQPSGGMASGRRSVCRSDDEILSDDEMTRCMCNACGYERCTFRTTTSISLL